MVKAMDDGGGFGSHGRVTERNSGEQRPVVCFICGKQMYYSGDERHEPEYLVDIIEEYHTIKSYYVHQKCWKFLEMGMYLEGRVKKEAQENTMEL